MRCWIGSPWRRDQRVQADAARDQGEAHPVSVEVCEVIITSDDTEWLVSFSRELVEERLCACAHIISPMRSIYRWEGAIHDEREARVALHTRAELVSRIVERTGQSHSYEVPCVIALPIRGGNPEYIALIEEETRAR